MGKAARACLRSRNLRLSASVGERQETLDPGPVRQHVWQHPCCPWRPICSPPRTRTAPAHEWPLTGQTSTVLKVWSEKPRCCSICRTATNHQRRGTASRRSERPARTTGRCRLQMTRRRARFSERPPAHRGALPGIPLDSAGRRSRSCVDIRDRSTSRHLRGSRRRRGSQPGSRGAAGAGRCG